MYAPQTVYNQSIAGVLMKVLLALHPEQTLILLLISSTVGGTIQFKYLDTSENMNLSEHLVITLSTACLHDIFDHTTRACSCHTILMKSSIFTPTHY